MRATVPILDYVSKSGTFGGGVVSYAGYGTVVRYGSKFKIVLFKYNPYKAKLLPCDKMSIGNDSKLSNNISRARSCVYELAMCNHWDYFITLTINQDKADRHCLSIYKKKLSQWLRNYNRLNNLEIKYLLVPEQHKDGAWHMHGLIKGLPLDKLSPFVKGLHPKKLVNSSYQNWCDYESKFGFCSLDNIKNHEAVSAYLVKYVSKGFGEAHSGVAVGEHLYICSRGLERSEPVCDGFFFLNRELNCSFDNDYCTSEWLEASTFSFDYCEENTVQIFLPPISS